MGALYKTNKQTKQIEAKGHHTSLGYEIIFPKTRFQRINNKPTVHFKKALTTKVEMNVYDLMII